MTHWRRKKRKLLAQWCPTLRYPMDYSLPSSSVRGILQARLLEWVAIPFSRGSSWPWDQILASGVSCTGRQMDIIVHTYKRSFLDSKCGTNSRWEYDICPALAANRRCRCPGDAQEQGVWTRPSWKGALKSRSSRVLGSIGYWTFRGFAKSLRHIPTRCTGTTGAHS